jgi:threonine synthase
MIQLRCSTCQQLYPADTRAFRCNCGGTFELVGLPAFDRRAIDPAGPGLWRYRQFLPGNRHWAEVTLGEGWTPLVLTDLLGQAVHCKMEFLSPTGSFKDRGTAVTVAMLKELGIDAVVEDSSGNAAASLAAYGARAGIRVRLYVPAHASPAKLRQIAVYGAELVPVDGPRSQAALAAWQAAATTYYASHYFNPFNLAGLRTLAFEIVEQLGWRSPDHLILPVGHGTLLLGAYQGFVELRQAGVIEHLPRFFAVQALACAPVFAAWSRALDQVAEITPGTTVAEGIAIAAPVRGAALLAVLRASGGMVVTVDEDEIRWGQAALARQGLYVEPTSAVVAAAVRKLDRVIAPGDLTVVVLTGSGLKSERV